MKVFARLDCLLHAKKPVMLAAGFFDGLHRGHRCIIGEVIRAARREQGLSCALTFDTHPRKVLCPHAAPSLLTDTPHKLSLLAETGLDVCVALPFNRRIASMAPRAFAALLARSAPGLRQIVVGRNWSFGHGGKGTPALLQKLAGKHAFTVRIIPPVVYRGQPVSSTRIRRAVLAGKLGEARRMLGRSFSMRGTVRSGRRLGRRLGAPTANLDPHNEVMPPNGVYLVRARIGRRIHNGLVNIGVRPTLRAQFASESRQRCLELHVLDLRRNLYGKIIEVFFLKKMRAEREFADLDALRAQIARDLRRARRWFAGFDE